ncbi:MAG: hypothetical protein RL536_500 [Candidatus Parcubacteria bacterium]|jgi:oligoendopeptidase F
MKFNSKTEKYNWNLGQLYTSPKDPKIEEDMKKVEKAFSDFRLKYDTHNKLYLIQPAKLLEALNSYESLCEYGMAKPLFYFFYAQSLNSSDAFVTAQLALLSTRLTKAGNQIRFFQDALGKMPKKDQQTILSNTSLKHFHYLLKCMFDDAKHQLSVAEEKIMALKSLPAKEMWVSHNDKILDSQMISWKNKKIPINQALEMIAEQKTSAQRKQLAQKVYDSLKNVATFSEGEINAIFTDKKINDELRGFSKPYEDTVREYRNDIKVVENLRKIVTDAFPIAHRFYKLKARLLKQKHLNYSDRAASIGTTQTKYSFDDSVNLVEKAFAKLDQKYPRIIRGYIKNGQIDVFPKTSKAGGAFCSGSYLNPTFILLNHVDSLRSMTTLAHELGHAFHTELSRNQGPIYCDYSYALAETASTLFEGIAFDEVFETLTEKDKVVALHDKINNSIATIFRQIACFNFELELHNAVRTKGFVAKEEIAEIHNKNMQAYLGPAFKMIPDDGYMFVSWGHIRRFFYVYSYVYGLIVSQAMHRNYKKDKKFWKKIEQFLSSGGSDSPENILREIGIDVTKPDFFAQGLAMIEDDIALLERMTNQ